ncbi:MAG: hypothetical protein Q6373_003690 [Candidatus Sigynarchaeota archaeon]
MATETRRGLSERVARMAHALERRMDYLKALQGSGFTIATILFIAISTHFFVQTLRSVIIAPAIFDELLPVFIALIATPFAVAALTLVCNDPFLGLVGAFVQALGRGFLLMPSDAENLGYYAGMICGIFGYSLAFLGVLGAVLTRSPLNVSQDQEKTRPSAIAGGTLLGMAMNIVLRLPSPVGASIAENILCNCMLFLVFSSVALYWYKGHHQEHNILKNVLPADTKRGKAKKFRKTLHIFMLGPCFAVLGFYFNRPEWIAAAAGMPYTATAYVLVLSILVAPLVRALGVFRKQARDVVTLACIAASFVGIGFMHFLPAGPYLLILIVPTPFGLGLIIDRAISQTALERADNVDITIILAWMVSLASILGSNVLSLLIFIPYAGIIVMAPLVLYTAIDAINTIKRGSEVGE